MATLIERQLRSVTVKLTSTGSPGPAWLATAFVISGGGATVAGNEACRKSISTGAPGRVVLAVNRSRTFVLVRRSARASHAKYWWTPLALARRELSAGKEEP